MKRILGVLGTDEAANEAVTARLAEIAPHSSMALLLSVVHEPTLDGYLGNTQIYEPLRKRLVAEADDKAGALVEKLRQSGIEAQSKAVWGWPRGDVIGRAAQEFGAGIIVLSFGLGHARHVGSRDWRFLAECPLPVLVVNGAADSPYSTIAAAVDPIHSHAKPAGLDIEIVRQARAVELLTGAKLSLVHGFAPLARFELASDDIAPLPLEDAEHALETSRREALGRLARETGIDPASARLIEGGPESALQSLMEQGEADLVVMGALARGRLADFIIGSTAERLLRHAGSDILLVKPAPS